MKGAFGRKTNTTGKSQRELLKCLRKLQRREANQSCCDCGVQDPEWGVIFKTPASPSDRGKNIRNENHPEHSVGAFVCYACSVAHKMLAIPTTEIKSISVGSWTHPDILAMERGGNRWVNATYEADLVKKKGQKPTEASEMLRRQAFCHLKYVRRWYYVDENSESPVDETSDDELLLDFVTCRSERQTRTLSPPSIPENWEKPMLVSKHDDDPWWEPPNDASIATLTTVGDSLYESGHSRPSFGSSISSGIGWSSHSRLGHGSLPTNNIGGWSSHSRLSHSGPSTSIPTLSSHSQASLESTAHIARESRRMSTGGMEVVSFGESPTAAPSPPPEGFASMRSPGGGTPRQRRQRRRSSIEFKKESSSRSHSQRRLSLIEGQTQSSSRSLSKSSINPRVSVKLPETGFDLDSTHSRTATPRMASRHSSLPEQMAMPKDATDEFPHLPQESWTSPKIHRLTSPRQTKSTHRRTNLLKNSPPSRHDPLPALDLNSNHSRKTRPKMATRHLSLPEPASMPQDRTDDKVSNFREESWTTPRQRTTHRRTSTLQKAAPSRRNSLTDVICEMNESVGETTGSGRLKYIEDDECSGFAVQQKQPQQQRLPIHQEIQSTSRASSSKQRCSNRRQRRNSMSETCQGLISKQSNAGIASPGGACGRRRQSLQFLRESLGPLDSEAPKW